MNEVSEQVSAILRLQAEILKLPQPEFKTEHYFADGMYLRWLPRKKGTLIIGKVHRKEHFYLVISGCVQIEKTIYQAPCVIVSKPGTKRAVLALEDSICATVHRTNETDMDKIEAELTEPDETAGYLPGNIVKHGELCHS